MTERDGAIEHQTARKQVNHGCVGSRINTLNDVPLLALAPVLEAVARPYLDYDRDNEVTSADPDCEEARAHYRALSSAVEAVADLIFQHQPETIAGLLVIAHATAVMADESWEEDPRHLSHDSRLLRFVCNGLFRLAGVDWRGTAIPDAQLPSGAPQPHALDAVLIPLAEAAIAEERAASAIADATDHDAPPGTFARSMQLLELVTSTKAITAAGLAAKAQLLLTHAPEAAELDGDWRCAALALSIARDAARVDLR